MHTRCLFVLNSFRLPALDCYVDLLCHIVSHVRGPRSAVSVPPLRSCCYVRRPPAICSMSCHIMVRPRTIESLYIRCTYVCTSSTTSIQPIDRADQPAIRVLVCRPSVQCTGSLIPHATILAFPPAPGKRQQVSRCLRRPALPGRPGLHQGLDPSISRSFRQRRNRPCTYSSRSDVGRPDS